MIAFARGAKEENAVDWDVLDFAIFGALLAGVAVTYLLAARKTGNAAYRLAVSVALAAAFLLIWVNGAVGIIGNETNDANMMFFGVLVVGVTGAIVARFHPHGMARALFATATAQVLVAAIALIARFGATNPNWPQDVLILTGFFTMLWLISAWLFQKSARERPAGARSTS